jgi:hypothetical protein
LVMPCVIYVNTLGKCRVISLAAVIMGSDPLQSAFYRAVYS